MYSKSRTVAGIPYRRVREKRSSLLNFHQSFVKVLSGNSHFVYPFQCILSIPKPAIRSHFQICTGTLNFSSYMITTCWKDINPFNLDARVILGLSPRELSSISWLPYLLLSEISSVSFSITQLQVVDNSQTFGLKDPLVDVLTKHT